ncbi:MAG TPA: uroporphyrinogen-III C-methyltransferase [Gammaproteobacteria bacterium]
MNNEDNNDKAKTPPVETAAQKPDPKPAAKKAADKPAPKRMGVVALLARLLLLLLIIGGLAAAGWFGWHWLRSEKTAYDDTIAEQAEAISRLESEVAQLRETRAAADEVDALREDVETTRMELRDRMNRIATDMDALSDAAQGGRRDLMRAEIEYLLRVAADALYLTQDVDTAIYALQAADDRLRALADPRFMPVRQLISDHLQALGAISVPDVNGMALRLGSLMQEVSEFPLRQAQHARTTDDSMAGAAEDAGWWQQFRNGVTRLFDKLVVVQDAEPPPPLLKPDEHFFLYRNVELQLAAARAALLTGDAAAYRQSLETAREWLNRYFDTSDPAVANAIADISGLLDVTLQPSLPDVTAALERFRALQNGAYAE